MPTSKDVVEGAVRVRDLLGLGAARVVLSSPAWSRRCPPPATCPLGVIDPFLLLLHLAGFFHASSAGRSWRSRPRPTIALALPETIGVPLGGLARGGAGRAPPAAHRSAPTSTRLYDLRDA